MEWFYADGKKKKGPVGTSTLKELVQSGAVADNTLVWHRDLDTWQPCKTVRPEFFDPEEATGVDEALLSGTNPPLPVETGGAGESILPGLIDPIFRNRAWLRFLGVVMIVYALVSCLQDPYSVLVAWLPAWLGVLLIQSANLTVRAQTSGKPEDARELMRRIGLSIRFSGIFILVLIIIAILLIGALMQSGQWPPQFPVPAGQ